MGQRDEVGGEGARGEADTRRRADGGGGDSALHQSRLGIQKRLPPGGTDLGVIQVISRLGEDSVPGFDPWLPPPASCVTFGELHMQPVSLSVKGADGGAYLLG